MNFLLFIFWISGGLIIYTVAIYYFILKVLKQNNYEKNERYLPNISLIICAYNEEKCVAAKLKNTFTLDYPLEKLQIILADDGSTDKTLEIANGFDFVEILKLSRGGKTSEKAEEIGRAHV